MKIEVKGLGKRYRRSWIFRDLEATFMPGERWAITGPNGSGKSTLVKILAGSLRPTQGHIDWVFEGKSVAPQQVFQHISLAAPYLELIEPFSLTELLQFHAELKPFKKGLNYQGVIELCGLQRHADKPIRDFSSGMMQRVRLATAFFSESSVLFLDEPTTNLDASGKAWFDQMLEQFGRDRLVIIASNLPEEVRSCTHKLEIGSESNSRSRLKS